MHLNSSLTEVNTMKAVASNSVSLLLEAASAYGVDEITEHLVGHE